MFDIRYGVSTLRGSDGEGPSQIGSGIMSKRLSGDMVDALAYVVLSSIRDDMRAGVVGAPVVDGFAMLHDHVDANGYLLQALPASFVAEPWGDYHWGVVQRLEEAVDDMLSVRPLVQPLPRNGREVRP